MEQPPQDKMPGGSVPQAGKRHNQEQAAKAHKSAASCAFDQRYIEVVAKPGGEGDVPATPELGYVK